ncbi:M13 family metallopeptidase [Capnocytophaga sp. oral taxon 338]|uniref:M13 family metallopeptidase n=1 Tax=Capnocytophaga sp. oral taxon 338 TaxID=710239 RepID=UPI000202E8EB|nr:M13 family metallopeptidase [Capnocytophaga sp. oral taxon 338]EGD34870.1 metalloendopeptidase PepO [Capnocytophaga sp. oral taxon 338 str. F0234]
MKKINFKMGWLACLSLMVACGNSNKKENAKEFPEKGLELSAMDTSLRPGDDFYNYVSGSWMKTTKIPADKPAWGSFYMLMEKTDEQCLSILDDLLKKEYPQGSEGAKIQILYKEYISWDKRNADGLKPLEMYFQKIDAIHSLNDLQNYLQETTSKRANHICPVGVYTDMKNSKMNAVYLGNFALGLGKDYYQKENPSNTEALAKYQDYVTDIFKILKDPFPQEKAKQIVAFEKNIAKYMLTSEEENNPNLSYNPITTKELSTLVRNLNLPQLLEKVGVHTERVILTEIGLYKHYDTFINEKNLPLIKDYLKYKLVTLNSNYLTQELNDLTFNFYNKYLMGQQEQRPMDKRALELINGILGEAFGKLYVEKYFPEKAKEEMLTLIDYLKKSFAQHIKNVTWMSDATKEKAMEKLHKFSVKVGYPDKWEDYSKLTMNPEVSLFENITQVAQWAFQKALDKVGKEVDKTKWVLPPQTVNAYYDPTNNEIVFPAGILQPPFFSFEADPAVNFGGIGGVIGHEMTHGFDVSGAEFDADGNLQNWWAPTDKENFQKATEALAKQYDQYEPVKGIFVNGTMTNVENIADLGGVNIAFDALQMYLKDHGTVGKISGFTQEQRFFLAWASVWRTLSTDQYMTNQVKVDPHSPDYLRAFAPLTNIDAWYKAFDIKEGDKLYRKPEQRIKIW